MSMDGDARMQLDPPRFEDVKPMLIAGMRARYTSETVGDIPAQWQRMVPYLDSTAQRLERIDFGVIWDMREGEEGFDYLSGFEVSDCTGLPAELLCIPIPAMRCAVFPHRMHVSRLKDTMLFIWHQWLPASGCEPAGGIENVPDMIERYSEEFDPQTGLGGMEVWIPVKC